MKSTAFNPDKDVPLLTGKVILITGGNAGIGKEAAIKFAKRAPAELWITGRSHERSKPALAEIQAAAAPGVSVRFQQLDLGSFESVKSAARAVLASVSRLDVLICNAGIMGGALGVTQEGYELRFGTNHMGHALLVKLLAPLLSKTAATLTSPKEVRVVVVASEAHKYVPKEGIHLDRMKSDGRPLTAIDLYSESKLANVLYGQELARRFAGQFTVVPIDPGHFATGLYTSKGAGIFIGLLGVMVRFIGTSMREAGKNYLWAATSSDVVSGEYYRPVGVGGDGGPFSKDEALRRRLWECTEKELEGHVL